MALLTVMACAGSRPSTSVVPSDATAPITGQVRAFYAALGSGDSSALRAVVTDNFYFFEHAEWNLDTLLKLMPRLAGRRWAISDACVTIGQSLAHITYRSTPVGGGPGWWLESMLLKRDDGRWRIAFLHVTRMPPPLPAASATRR